MQMASGFTILRDDLLRDLVDSPRTLCVTGLARGGTTSVALLLANLGVFMGRNIDPLNHEDLDLRGALKDKNATARIVSDYNAAHPIWGFKAPRGVRVLKALVPVARNPVAIIVGRNPMNTTRGRLARGAHEHSQSAEWLLDAQVKLHKQSIMMLEWCSALTCPVLLVEYEKILAAPKTFVVDFADALHLTMDDATLEIAASQISTGYKGGQDWGSAPAT